MRVVTLGVHVLDVLVRPVQSIPEGQGSQLVEQIKITAAGTAGGTALTLAKLGARVRTAGAVGADAAGDMLLSLLERGGVDTAAMVRRADVQTSASVLPIRLNGDRPAFHVVGANAGYGLDDVPWDAIAESTHLHLGGPEFLGGETAAQILAFAREHGVTTSADILTDGNPGLLEWISQALPLLDHLLPNAEQVLGLTGETTLATGCQALRERGIGTVVATAGADGALVADADGEFTAPALAAHVVDTTGCGDAFSAGYLRGLSLGQAPRTAAVLGNATAGLVAGGLGSDHGDFDLARAQLHAAG
ncbi:carbohydrate kinase family protein [Tomitella biformata]|uniref:carbohydrate kinase family protein n=1 Tax=Tomitella biformata TaxID=630403 RepID=UPI0004B640F1|nr:PfkB family carbohydrate kinase [Tomitella biformata]